MLQRKGEREREKERGKERGRVGKGRREAHTQGKHLTTYTYAIMKLP